MERKEMAVSGRGLKLYLMAAQTLDHLPSCPPSVDQPFPSEQVFILDPNQHPADHRLRCSVNFGGHLVHLLLQT